MSGSIGPSGLPDVHAFGEDLLAWRSRLAGFLGLDPAVVLQLDDVAVLEPDPPPSAEPGGTDLTWESPDPRQHAVPGPGRVPMSDRSRRDVDEPALHLFGVHLDADETARMRAEVGERPELAPFASWKDALDQPAD